MAKNLDGIKKLNPEDIKKYRKIVLNYIGEKDPSEASEQKVFFEGAASLRRVDGVKESKISSLGRQARTKANELSVAGKLLPSPPNSLAGALNDKKEKSADINPEDKGRLEEAVKRQAEERKMIKEEDRQYRLKKEQAEKEHKEQERTKQERKRQLEIERQKRELVEKKRLEREEITRQEELKKKEITDHAKRETEEKKRAEEVKRWQEKIRLEELEDVEKRRIKENLRIEKIKREEEVKRVKREIKINQRAAREKKRNKRRRAWQKFKKNFKKKEIYSVIIGNTIYIIVLSLLCFAIIYIVFCLVALRFKVDNSITRLVAGYLPVPAVITDQGIISYNEFKKIENKDYLNFNLSEKKNYLASWVVWRGLAQKYGLPADVSADDLAIKYVLDKDFNQVGLSRINKINELVKGLDSFEELGKNADEYNEGTYYSLKGAVEKFGPAVLDLAIDQISSIIPRGDGYYIVERIGDKNGQIGLKYLLVKAQTLEQYVSGKLENIKVFILSD